MEVVSILAGVGSFTLFAGAVWYLSQEGFPGPARGPWRTLLDLARLPWAGLLLLCALLRRRCGAGWEWQPVFCDTCWWAGRLGRCPVAGGCFTCPRCGEDC